MDDKQLFELWEKKIKIELTAEITSNRLSLWSLCHNLGHKTAAFVLEGCRIDLNDMIIELGCGDCNLARFLTKDRVKNYVGVDISRDMLSLAKSEIKRIQADLYSIPFSDGIVRVIISIYNLEHLHRLDEALNEIYRVLDKEGIFIFVIPMENGFLYNLGRYLTSKRLVEKRYGVDYMKIIREYEHPNNACDILKKVNKTFHITNKLFLPFLIPSLNLNIFGVFKAEKK